MINGESYKRIVAEAARNALGDENIQERVFIVRLIADRNGPRHGSLVRRVSAFAITDSTSTGSSAACSLPVVR